MAYAVSKAAGKINFPFFVFFGKRCPNTNLYTGLHLMKTLAETQGPKVRINAVLPGFLLTEWVGCFIQSSSMLQLTTTQGSTILTGTEECLWKPDSVEASSRCHDTTVPQLSVLIRTHIGHFGGLRRYFYHARQEHVRDRTINPCWYVPFADVRLEDVLTFVNRWGLHH